MDSERKLKSSMRSRRRARTRLTTLARYTRVIHDSQKILRLRPRWLPLGKFSPSGGLMRIWQDQYLSFTSTLLTTALAPPVIQVLEFARPFSTGDLKSIAKVEGSWAFLKSGAGTTILR